MKDLPALIRFLYDSEDEVGFRDDLLNLTEQIETENMIKVKKGPLSQALSSLDVTVPDDKLVPDYASAIAHFDSAVDYQDAVNKLETPVGMEKLAELGWVMNIRGDSDPDGNGTQSYQIRFIQLDLHDGPPDDSQKDVNLDKVMKDAAKATFSDSPDDPKRKLQKQAESAVQSGAKMVECAAAVRKLKNLKSGEIVSRLAKKGMTVTRQKVDSILRRK